LKHHLSFDTAQFVFEDPMSLSRPDSFEGEERWQTIGRIGSVIIFVIHTLVELRDESESGRIISARKATPFERRSYEEGTF
jgi:uncharacterized protein